MHTREHIRSNTFAHQEASRGSQAIELGIQLMADEVLTSTGRTGKFFCMERWDTVPDVATIGKGFGNGFSVTEMLVSEKYQDSISRISITRRYRCFSHSI